ncbi:MAG: 3-oxoacyl-ACP synthase [Deltaproteobacteria bacterium]|nr:3-oxoacyl-ACP synthase [Deltaproteobacteria bacterium]
MSPLAPPPNAPAVYLTHTGSFLPNDPVDAERAEEVLGLVNGKPCPLRRRVLKSNGIVTRHYALNAQQEVTHTLEDLAIGAAGQALERAGLDLSALGLLATATTQGDLAVPGLAAMLHGRLAAWAEGRALGAVGPCDVLSAHGVCASGVAALQGAYHALLVGEHDHALVCAAELPSRQLRASRYEAALRAEEAPRFEADAAFLRWMLSDGAGAALLSRAPSPRGLSLRLDWVRLRSFAHALPVCMYAGRSPRSGARASWLDYPTYAEAEADGAMLLRQDTRLLDHIVKLGVQEFLEMVSAGRIEPTKIDHFLCHYSSHYFRGPIVDLLTLSGAMVPEERWFTNLYSKGNTGCASILIMLDELMTSGRLAPGQRVVCAVPESGRFSVGLMHFTVVAPAPTLAP